MTATDINPRRRRGRLGAVALAPALGIILIAGAAPLLAWDQPIICRHEGRWYFPALAVAGQNLPLVGRFVERSTPFRFPDFDAKEQLDPNSLALWPPIAYQPAEITDRALTAPSRAHWLGTDDRGRDVAARLVHGATVSVRVGFLATMLAGAVGIVIGAVAGYFGGWLDWVLSRGIEATICFPVLFLVLAVLAWASPGTTAVILVIGLTQWTAVARLVRAEFLRMAGADYVLAARGYGASAARIVVRHMLPGALAPVAVTLAFGVAEAVVIEAGLSWLGFGVQAPAASWGQMLRSAYEQVRSAPYLVYPPCIAIFASVLAYHVAGRWLKRRLDPLAR
jgi:peptide/nickel transport system permease protein